ncbi:hypothetical protein AWB85_03210 [Mycobacteroides immunogenum]|uniref:HTH tetR-type domain-containing protein n=1 Tax=Mycobacteroides immunogenum TaxID=83262 RepID=A0A179VH57_9MYCO|nr:TetR/AcrR family transcriptional regulator [Mycobacteroides immunogenum]OAT70373.1 hypothetical protein AWB85_03210 [Mycobacteroides immunogenum]
MTAENETLDRRRRLLDSLAVCVLTKGYVKTTIADIVRGATTSTRSFYEHFDSRDDCLVELCRDRCLAVSRAIVDSIDPGPWDRQVRDAMAAWGSAISADPGALIAWIGELPALGPRGQELQLEVMEGFIEALQTLTSTASMREAGVAPVSRSRAIFLLGGMNALATVAIESRLPANECVSEAVEIALELLGPRGNEA